MSWLDSAIEQANNPIDVDIEGLGLGIKTLQAKPLSAAEFQVLKSEPEIARLSGEDRNELLGLRVVYEMLAKCDSEVRWESPELRQNKRRTVSISDSDRNRNNPSRVARVRPKRFFVSLVGVCREIRA